MSSQPHNAPLNPLPAAVVALVLIIIGIEAVFSLGARGILGGPEAIGWRLEAIQSYAFSSEIFWWMQDSGRWLPEHLKRFATYTFVHGAFTHALFVCVFVLAMGKMVGEVMGDLAMVIIFILSGAGGALGYALLVSGGQPLIGGFPAVYGLIGAFTFLLWRSLASVGAQQSRAFTLIAFLMGAQLLFGLLFGGQKDWVADLAGFATGFGLSFFLAPGGWARIRNRIRHD
ncbi:rhomboid family intramembrane serine protease [Leisingera aquaemixtae]|uniref:rhomboid family intramembrane serine protease n=1 Tax=Leisingera aquaemixtae TaxID=1396826 RepID=UPI0021A910A9|nr:rhomboid family intramembrane serine protease [Leisingera aquaemixtae]UWQ24191.1 rhomboid family intramembrane serine protease [Leisingera aquaemixtae]UWQ36727.1 rhomboid family intramembrane serine protease [Leisingera aquaemixtae]